MILAEPFWIVLIIPLVLALWAWPLPSRLMQAVRIAALSLVVLALCGLSLRLPARSGTVVVVADRSLSMPPGSDGLQTEAAGIVSSAMRAGDKLAVVSFAERAAVEQSPQPARFSGFSAEVGREASRLADALDLGLSLLGPEEPGRLLVLSDGQWTGRDVAAAAARAAAAGVAIDYRPIQRARAGDLAIDRLEGPGSVLPGESFMITAWIDSPLGQKVSYELLRGAQLIARGTQAVPSGTSRLVFRDSAAGGGLRDYVLRIAGQGTDPVPENNRARLLVGVAGARPLLCVGRTAGSGLAALLAKGGLDVDSRTPADCLWTLEELSGYCGVLLEDTPASLIGHTGMQNLAAWVSQSGGGLMITGGKDSYGPGGYYRSPLEPILPVSMELRREHRKLSLAIVVALDRSGSMAAPSASGRPKMELADLAAAEVLEMLGPMDQFGCLAVDSAAHEVVPLADVVDKAAMRSKVLGIASAGGGIFIYEALKNAARMILPAAAGTRHIILFADAADSEEPGDYKKLVEGCVKSGVTISVIGLGRETDCDAELLKDIARRGGGQCMFTNVAQELPRLFAQDTFLVARSAFLDSPVGLRPTGGLASITRRPFGDFPRIGGYNLCYLRGGANLALAADDEYKGPVVAAWQAGLGRVLCYTGEADGQYTGAISSWESAGDFFTSLGRWTAGRSQSLGRGLVATQELRAGVCRVELHLDPERDSTPFTRMPELTTLSALPGETVRPRKMSMTWSSADTLLAEIPLASAETTLTTVEVAPLGQVTLAPVCLPYSPEYRPQKTGGLDALEQLARATGGRERLNLAEIWRDIPKTPRWIALAPWLLLAAVALFLLEILQRRTGLLALRPAPFRWRRRPTPAPSRGKTFAPQPPPSPAPAAAPKLSSLAIPEPPPDPMTETLAQAQTRARRRTNRPS